MPRGLSNEGDPQPIVKRPGVLRQLHRYAPMFAILRRITRLPNIRNESAPVVIDAEFIVSQRDDKAVFGHVQSETAWRLTTLLEGTENCRHPQSWHNHVVVKLTMDVTRENSCCVRLTVK